VRTEDIKARVKGWIGREIFFYETVGSTNTTAADLAEKTREGTVILADCQQKGRGRLGRPWLSPRGINIYMSIILRPDIEPKDTTLITLMAAVACALALRRVTGISITIKWPNDLMVSGRKIGGILTEMKTTGARIISVVVGIGVNVNGDPDSFPEEIREIATSVKNETGEVFSRERIIAEILNEMNRWYPFLKVQGREALLSEWKHLTSTLGKEVAVTTGQETFSGYAESIDNEGLLLLRLPSGELKSISSGDLTILK
jgi:BirA family biotin operon repressor/biotin-[acetyl-CoA-carboxylase] ligase